MAAHDDVLIIGSLSDKDMRRSIDDLVNYVDTKTNKMADSFESAIGKMNTAMKDFAINQKVSVTLMKEAWRDMSASFDAMVRAQEAANGRGTGTGTKAFDDNTVGALEQEISLLKQKRKEMQLDSDELRNQNRELEQRKRLLKEQTTSEATKRITRAMDMPMNDLDSASKKLRLLEILQRRYADTTELSSKQTNQLTKAIAKCKEQVDKFNNTKPKTLTEVLGMSEKGVDAIAKKMRALKQLQIDPKNTAEVKKLGDEYQRLSRLQAELLGKGIQLTHSNNYLAQSFGYIRNRVVYALTLGAVTNFTKQVYEIRGQYELLERSLGILINDMRKGTEMFNELNAMALKSPFTLMELATGAKQLLAYNFAEEEVVDTTRRLADISAALGVPMERLVYNLGQIKAQTALTARDARDFANAGLAIVPMLAQMYTEQKRFGDEIVTTAQVFDMMSKKMVSYNDVMKVINKVTDEGGKFFDFQARQADTLRVKMANLTLAWNNMLNEVGQDNQGVLELPLRGLKTLFENWRALVKVVKEVILVFGAYKAAAMLVSLWNSRLVVQGSVVAFFELAKSVKSAKDAMILFNTVCKLNPIGLIASAIAAAVGYFYLFNDAMDEAGGYTEKFGKAGAKVITETEALFDTLKGMSRESSNYKKVMGELNSILEEYGLETVKETDGMDVLNEKRRVAIALIKEETLERKHLNEVQQGRDEYTSTVNEARDKMRSQLKEAVTGMYGFVSANNELRQNASAIANIISDVVEQNISLIAGKTGEEYEKGVNKIYDTIQERMRAIGISESTISKQWLDDTLFLKNDIVGDFIEKIRAAKEEQDRYIESIDKAYESEKKAAKSGASFNDRVEQTQTQLMKAANDTENFYKKVDQLVKDYSGLNIIDFLVKVKTEVPAWMSQKGLTELTQLSARFTALATNAKKAGKSALNVNGTEWTVEQLFQRAAQYTQAAQNKAADIEARKSSTITREASEALKEYKSALEAVGVAKNRLKRGTGDQALVTEKETAAQKAYNKALERGVSLEELQKAKNGKGSSGSKKDKLGEALAKEVQLISEMQKLYKDYQKAGVDSDTARIASAKEYEKTLKATNKELAKFGIKGLSGEELTTMDLRSLRDYYTQLRDLADTKGNTKGVEALEKAIRNLNIEITKIDYKKITEGLNNELGKIKEDYELAVELDANPELGGMFADLFNIDTSALPHTFDEAMRRVQSSVNKTLNELNIKSPFNVLTGDLKAFADSVGHTLDSDAFKGIEKAQKYIRDLWKKTTDDIVKDWNTLLEKYGDYQSKMTQVVQETAKQQLEVIRKFGTDQEQAEALDLTRKITLSSDPSEIARIQKQLADLIARVVKGKDVAVKISNSISNADKQKKSKIEWEEFKDSELYSLTFEDMDRVSTRAIQSIISQLDKLKDKVKDDPASMKALMDAYKKGREELESRAPFENIITSLREWRQAAKEAADAQKNLQAAKLEEQNAQTAVQNLQSRGDTGGKGSGVSYAERLAKAQERLAKATKAKNKAEIDASKAEIKQINSQKKFQNALNNSATALQNVGGLLTQFAELLGIAEDSEAGQMVKSLAQGFTMMASALSMVAVVAQIAEMSLGWVAIVAAALSVVVGLVSFLAGASDRDITNQIKQSELAVKRLENSYKNLEVAVENAYGAMQISARKAAIANKELQLVELQRQLQLEKSRSSKKRDADKIADLEGQIIDLKNEIQDMKNDITNSFLGISSVSDAVSSMMDDIIDALRNGEDAMLGFNDSIDDMIANMIKQVFSARILGPMLEKIWQQIDDDIQKRGEQYADYYASYKASLDHIITNTNDTGDGYYFWKDQNGSLWYSNSIMRYIKAIQDGAEALTYEAWKSTLQGWESWAKGALEDATTPTMNDVRTYADKLRQVSPELEGYIGALEDILKEMGLIKDTTKENALSALQQGIQGVTEDTAGAIEAYMNGVSQQVYLQSDILTQMRDTILGFNLDVQVATIGQMLLQLQQSYQVQQSIENILQGVLNPSGRAFCVEMI